MKVEASHIESRSPSSPLYIGETPCKTRDCYRLQVLGSHTEGYMKYITHDEPHATSTNVCLGSKIVPLDTLLHICFVLLKLRLLWPMIL